jgi:hypothetical protein
MTNYEWKKGARVQSPRVIRKSKKLKVMNCKYRCRPCPAGGGAGRSAAKIRDQEKEGERQK